MIRFSALLSLTLCAVLTQARAQVGELATNLDAEPLLSAFTRSGNTLVAADGRRINLVNRGPYLAGVSVTLPTFSTQSAGQLLTVLGGFDGDITPAYAEYLNAPGNQAALLRGSVIQAGPYDLSSRRSGAGLNFSLKLHQVPVSAFVSTPNARGPQQAAVVLRLFSDFQCPYCQQFEEKTWPVLKTQLPPGVRFEFHHLPLERVHPNARAAAEASECAAAQEQFWAFKDALFVPATWQRWVRASDPAAEFSSVAQTLGLGSSAFETCLSTQGGKANVDAGLRESGAVQVGGTPTLFVGGYQVQDALDPASTLKLVQYVLGK